MPIPSKDRPVASEIISTRRDIESMHRAASAWPITRRASSKPFSESTSKSYGYIKSDTDICRESKLAGEPMYVRFCCTDDALVRLYRLVAGTLVMCAQNGRRRKVFGYASLRIPRLSGESREMRTEKVRLVHTDVYASDAYIIISE